MIGEEAMLWSAIFLDVLRNAGDAPALLSPSMPAAIVTAADVEAEATTTEAAAA